MKISVVGLGYVGAVSAAVFAHLGHDVIGVDLDRAKVDLINAGRAPIVEKDLDRYIKEGVESGRLRATADIREAILDSEITFVAVGTPSLPNGNIDLRYIRAAAEDIGEALRGKEEFHAVVMRSTVLPGTGKNVVIPAIEKSSGKKAGEGFGYASNPEFLRESSAIEDFFHPPKTVVGPSDKKSAEILRQLYAFLDAPYFEVGIEEAEMVKYADNAWHAVKVTFANEIGIIAKRFGVDSHRVMEVFCADTKLNISCYYLRPGFAFGGSCLPKDVRALTYAARHADAAVAMLESVLPSNEQQIKRVYKEFIAPLKKRRVGVLGISFKAGTDDLRESPILELTETLIGKGYEVEIYDPNLLKAKEGGVLAEYLAAELPHIDSRLRKSMEEVIGRSEIVIIGNANKAYKGLYRRYPQKFFIDVAAIEEKSEDKNLIRIV